MFSYTIIRFIKHSCTHIVTLSSLKTKENSWQFSKDTLSMVIYQYTLSIENERIFFPEHIN